MTTWRHHDTAWCAGCYTDIVRVKHFRIRKFFEPEWYVDGHPSWGFRISFGYYEISFLWGVVNSVVYSEIKKERKEK